MFREDHYEYSIYFYNENNKLIEESRFDEEGESYGTKYIYTKSGNIQEVIIHSPYISVPYIGKYKKREKNKIGTDRLEEERMYDSLDRLIMVNKYSSDFYDPNEAHLYSRTKYRYDRLSRKIGEYNTEETDTITSFKEYEYNKKNDLIKQRFTLLKYNVANYELEYFYDSNKNIQKVIYTKDKEKIVINFTYKFDNRNNWVEQSKSIDGEVLYIRKRALEYY